MKIEGGSVPLLLVSTHSMNPNWFLFIQVAAAKPEDPYKERKIALGTKLRDIIAALRNDPAVPNPANKAMETAVGYCLRIPYT